MTRAEHSYHADWCSCGLLANSVLLEHGEQVQIVGATDPAYIVYYMGDMILVRDETDTHRRLFHGSMVMPMGSRENS